MRSVIDTMTTLITAPEREPLTIDFVKRARRMPLGATSIDTLFDLWIAAARSHFEEQTGRQVMTATRELWLDGFPRTRQIELPYPPLQAVTSIVYDDGDGVEQTYEGSPLAYRVIAPAGDYCQRGRVELVGSTWPTPGTGSGSVRIRFTCGYSDTADGVPELIRALLLFLVGHFQRYGEEVQEPAGTLAKVPLGAKTLMEAFRYTALPTFSPRRGFVYGDDREWPWEG